MTIVFPDAPGISAAIPRLVDGGSWQSPIVGGVSVRIERPNGCHMAVDFTTPRIPLIGLAMIWTVRLNQAVRSPAQISYPQPELQIGDPGTPLVNGGNQNGAALNIRNGIAGYTVLEGQALNVYDASGRPYLHLSTATTVIASDGTATLAVDPPIRSRPADGTLVNIAAPIIEGKVIGGGEKGVKLQKALADGLQFSIEETR